MFPEVEKVQEMNTFERAIVEKIQGQDPLWRIGDGREDLKLTKHQHPRQLCHIELSSMLFHGNFEILNNP